MRYTVDSETKCWASVEFDGDSVLIHANEWFEDEEDAATEPVEDVNGDGWNRTATVYLMPDEAVELATAILKAIE
jgi:hypothetical protein